MMSGTGSALGLGGWLWMIVEVAVGIGVAVAIVWLMATALAGRQRSDSGGVAEILTARLARGEITEAEYEQARRLVGIN